MADWKQQFAASFQRGDPQNWKKNFADSFRLSGPADVAPPLQQPRQLATMSDAVPQAAMPAPPASPPWGESVQQDMGIAYAPEPVAPQYGGLKVMNTANQPSKVALTAEEADPGPPANWSEALGNWLVHTRAGRNVAEVANPVVQVESLGKAPNFAENLPPPQTPREAYERQGSKMVGNLASVAVPSVPQLVGGGVTRAIGGLPGVVAGIPTFMYSAGMSPEDAVRAPKQMIEDTVAAPFRVAQAQQIPDEIDRITQTGEALQPVSMMALPAVLARAGKGGKPIIDETRTPPFIEKPKVIKAESEPAALREQLAARVAAEPAPTDLLPKPEPSPAPVSFGQPTPKQQAAIAKNPEAFRDIASIPTPELVARYKAMSPKIRGGSIEQAELRNRGVLPDLTAKTMAEFRRKMQVAFPDLSKGRPATAAPDVKAATPQPENASGKAEEKGPQGLLKNSITPGAGQPTATPAPGTPKQRESRAAAERAILAIHDRASDIISGESPDSYRQDTGAGDQSTAAAPMYDFNDTPQGRSWAKEVRDRLPKNLQMNVRVRKGQTTGVSAEDSGIQPEQMAANIQRFADSGKTGKIRKTVDFVLKNPEQFSPDEVYAVQKWRAFQDRETAQQAKGKTPQNVPAASLGVGDKMTIAGEPFKVSGKSGGMVTVEDGITLELPEGADVAVDKGSLKQRPPEQAATRDLLGNQVVTRSTGQQKKMLFGGEDVTMKEQKPYVYEKPPADSTEAQIRSQYDESATTPFDFELDKLADKTHRPPPDMGTMPGAQFAGSGVYDSIVGAIPRWQSTKKIEGMGGDRPGVKGFTDMLHEQSDTQAAVHGPWTIKAKDAMQGLSSAERENLIMSLGKRETPKSEKVANALRYLDELEADKAAMADAVDLRMADGRKWSERGDWMPQQWNKDALRDVGKRGGPLYEVAVKTVMEQAKLDRAGAEEWLTKHRENLAKGIDEHSTPDPFEDRPAQAGSGIEKGVQLNRQIVWPREMLAENLGDAYFQHLERFANAVAKRVEFGKGGHRLREQAAKALVDVETEAKAKGRNIAGAVADAKRFMRDLTGRQISEPALDLTTQGVPHSRRVAYDVARRTVAATHLSIGSPFATYGNLLMGTASTMFRFGALRGATEIIKNLPTYFRETEVYRKNVGYGAFDHNGIGAVVAESPFAHTFKKIISGFAMATEAVNRTAAAEAGQRWSDAAARKLNKVYRQGTTLGGKAWNETREYHQLRDMRVPPPVIEEMARTGKVPESMRGRIARGAVQVSQYLARPIDLPLSWTTPGGRVAFQFWSMAFKQAQNTLNVALREAGHGDLIPLARFITIAAASGITANGLRNVMSGRPIIDKDRDKIAVLLQSIAESSGLYSRPLRPMMSSKPTNNLVSGLVTPAILSDADRIIGGAVNAVKAKLRGKNREALKALDRAASTFAGYRTAKTLVGAK